MSAWTVPGSAASKSLLTRPSLRARSIFRTKDLAQYSQSGSQFFGIHVSNHGSVLVFAGGIRLKRGWKVVGAVGVSAVSGSRITPWRKPAPKHSRFFIGANIYGKQSWSSLRRTGKSGSTAGRFSEVIAGITEVRARRDP